MSKMNLIDKLFFKQRSGIIKRYFNGVEYSTEDYNKKVYNAWYVDFKTNIGIILGIVSILITLL